MLADAHADDPHDRVGRIIGLLGFALAGSRELDDAALEAAAERRILTEFVSDTVADTVDQIRGRIVSEAKP